PKAWPALGPGRLLKMSSDGHRRRMTVQDRTRLIDRLSTFFFSLLEIEVTGLFIINRPALKVRQRQPQ
ncbi:hypothetical protein, partial [Escherichia coli]|uniref:hypothetical protein n=1 Tax=Escherichia coli TaxID=562 RepID=UPI00200BCC25